MEPIHGLECRESPGCEERGFRRAVLAIGLATGSGLAASGAPAPTGTAGDAFPLVFWYALAALCGLALCLFLLYVLRSGRGADGRDGAPAGGAGAPPRGVLTALFREFFARSQDAELILDRDTRAIVEANARAAAMLDRPESELIGQPFEALTDEVERDRARAVFDRAAAGENLGLIEQTLARPDGAVVQTEMTLFRAEAAGRDWLLASFRDISERKLQEEEIRTHIKRFVVLNEVGADLASTLDPTRLSELLCTHIASLIPTDEIRVDLVDEDDDSLTTIFTTRPDGAEPSVDVGVRRSVGECASERLVVRNRQYILLGGALDRYAYGLAPEAESGPDSSLLLAPMTLGAQIIGVIRVSCDRPKAYSLFHLEMLSNLANVAALAMRNAQLFEELTKSLGQVRDSESLLRGLVSQSPIAMWIGRPDGSTLLSNAPAAAMFGHGAADTLPEGFSLLADERLIVQGVDGELQRVASGEIIQLEIVLEDKASASPMRASRYRATFFPLFDAEGTVLNVVGLFEDVTATHALEAQLRQSQKMESVGTLAGGIAHDFNNLLTGILGYTSYLLERLQPEESHYRELRLIEQSAQRAADLTRQLLAFSRKTVTETKPIRLNHIVNETTRILQRSLRYEIELKTSLSANLWPAMADATQMQQVLLNLCINARDAMPEGGLLKIETANETLTLDRVRRLGGETPGDYVRVSVIDTGTGIQPEDMERIFDPFYTTKEVGEGSGLGLAMVYGIMQSLGGFITVESDVGSGSRFDLRLPVCADEEEAAEVKVEAQTPPRSWDGTETVLVVDDEEHILRLAEASLSNHGYRVLTAEDGFSALERLGEAGGEVSMVLLDVIMPGMNGREVARFIRNEFPGISILFSSGYASDEAPLESDLSDCGFIRKPYRVAELVQAVRETLDGDTVRIG